MKGARQIGWISGIPVRMHWSFFLVIVWSAYIGYRSGGWPAILFSISLTLILFVCVFLHELGHALMARCFGVKTRSITLLPIGGVAALERIPERPREELLIALAGPMVNVVIAAILWTWQGWPHVDINQGPPWDFSHLPEMVMLVNLFMIGFNMIPAFPMDGGRVLRAILAIFLSYPKATSVASALGQGLAMVMVVIGFSYNPFLCVIGAMVFYGAKAESRMVHLRSTLAGVVVRDVMTSPPATLRPDDPLRLCLEQWHDRGETDFIVERDGILVGIIAKDRWQRFLLDPRRQISAADVMKRPVILVRPDMPLIALCDVMRSGNQSVYPVVDRGFPVGLVPRIRLMEIMAQGIPPKVIAEYENRPVTVSDPPRSWLDVG